MVCPYTKLCFQLYILKFNIKNCGNIVDAVIFISESRKLLKKVTELKCIDIIHNVFMKNWELHTRK